MASLRDDMPETAAFIDMLREGFGKETIDAAIRAGLQGQPTFHAIENGREIGTPFPAGFAVIPATLTRAEIEAAEKARQGAVKPARGRV